MRRKNPEKLNIKNRSYQKISDQPIFITPELKKQLQAKKTKHGTRFELLETYGFKGGKHLVEHLLKGFKGTFDIVLTHELSRIVGRKVYIELLKFKSLNESVFRL